MTILGLIAIAAGSLILSLIPATLGIPSYIAPIVAITVGYALFQTSNNTAVIMIDIRPDQRGVISGMLNLSRNLELITGASVMSAVFASRGRCHRYADQVRSRGDSDRCRARLRICKPCSFVARRSSKP